MGLGKTIELLSLGIYSLMSLVHSNKKPDALAKNANRSTLIICPVNVLSQ